MVTFILHVVKHGTIFDVFGNLLFSIFVYSSILSPIICILAFFYLFIYFSTRNQVVQNIAQQTYEELGNSQNHLLGLAPIIHG